jgi:hypothetical protein
MNRTGLKQDKIYRDRTKIGQNLQEQDRILKDRILRTGHAQTNTPKKIFLPKIT